MNRFVALIVLSVLLLTSCKNTKNTSNAGNKKMTNKVLLNNMKAADFSYKYLSAKARATYNDGKNSQSFTANIRIEHNKTIWLSLTGPFGIEGARILIEPNRLQIVDKLSGTYEDKPLSEINSYIPFNVDLPFLESLLVGNTFNISSTGAKQKLEFEPKNYVLKENSNNIDATYFIDFDYKYTKAEFLQSKPSRKVSLNFSNYKIIENQLFSFLRNINFSENGNNINISLDFSKVKKESNLDFPFSIPDRLKK